MTATGRGCGHQTRLMFSCRTKTKMGDRAFDVAGPRTWKSLPETIRETKTFPAFKKQLKLYLIGNPEY